MRRTAIPIVMMMLSFLFPAPAAHADQAAVKFTDIKNHWAEPTIVRMVEQGILDGYPDGTFRPDEPVKVDQFIKMLMLSYSDLHPNGERSWSAKFVQSLTADNQNILKQDYRQFAFKPSVTGYWAKPFIDVASDLNFLNKARYSDFQANMKRENVAEVLYYTIKETEYLENDTFSQQASARIGDLQSANAREQKFIAEAFTKGIMEGYPNGYFGVGRSVTRAESLAILNRLTDKGKRITLGAGADGLSRIVPAKDGSYKKIVFPDQKMWQAYDMMQEAAKGRGTNYDLLETTLRLFKDKEEKQTVLNPAPGSDPVYEEAALWLEPDYKTFGITVRLREGTVARNDETIQTFVNYWFGYNADTFRLTYQDVCARVAAGRIVEPATVQIGSYRVDVRVDAASKAIMFSIAEKTVNVP